MKYTFKLSGLDCANCANKIEIKLNEHKDIDKAIVNFNKLIITVYSNKPDFNVDEVKKIVNEIEPDVCVISDMEDDKKNKNGIGRELIELIVGIVLFLISMIIKNNIINEVLLVGAYIILLRVVFVKAIKLLMKGRIDENLLVTISCIGAYFTDNIHEGLMVIVLYNIGKILEKIAVNNSRKSIKELMNIKPEYANKMVHDEVVRVSPEELEIGDIIVIKNGEKVPVDAVVIEGSSKMNTAMITGESKLLTVGENDKILSGMINTSSVLKVRVSNTYEDSTVAKILSLLDEATDKKAKTETFVSKAAKIYTPVVLVLSLLTFLLLPLFSSINYSESLCRALVFLVVACPCAIVISVPLSYFSGIGKASKLGILIKGSDYLDTISDIDTIIFDKTGTLTTGEFRDYELVILDDKYKKTEIEKYYVTGESLSNHPIAKSIINLFGNSKYKDIFDYTEVSGKGISYKYLDDMVKIGSSSYCLSKELDDAIYLNINDKNIAKLYLKDSLKKESKSVVKRLQEMGKKVKMYTGDNKEIADDIAKKLNIDEYNYGLLPQDKYKLLERDLVHDNVMFIGDGINDAPTLAKSTIGVSLGGVGSDAAIESADIVIMNDDLTKLITCINVSKYTRKIIKQNLLFAILVKILVLVLSFLGIASMWQAVFADTGVTLITIINTTRILKYKSE
ncbi:MAG: cadmium-translocating P-type ATPase [Erysipelotrichaceae bacterium]|nr:cadmium-translocating P-type ATPase [Erysipelotrichaceae bacterium]